MTTLLLVLALAVLVLGIVSSPWRRSHGPAPEDVVDERRIRAMAEVADLEAARDAKYREIRDAELDRQTGKLSGADHAAIDATLRAEAVQVLRSLDRARTRLEKLEHPAPVAAEEPAEEPLQAPVED